jgi:hypothetical protein
VPPLFRTTEMIQQFLQKCFPTQLHQIGISKSPKSSSKNENSKDFLYKSTRNYYQHSRQMPLSGSLLHSHAVPLEVYVMAAPHRSADFEACRGITHHNRYLNLQQLPELGSLKLNLFTRPKTNSRSYLSTSCPSNHPSTRPAQIISLQEHNRHGLWHVTTIRQRLRWWLRWRLRWWLQLQSTSSLYNSTPARWTDSYIWSSTPPTSPPSSLQQLRQAYTAAVRSPFWKNPSPQEMVKSERK